MDTGLRGATRRAVLGGMGGGVIGALSASASLAAAEPGMRGLIPAADLMLQPGFVHLQTGTVGATPRPVFEAGIRAWTALEADPTRSSYGPGVDRLDAVRATAARLVGASTEEIVLTTGTTSGMNMVAQGLGLRSGDRVLTTEQQHPGGRLGWDWLARHQGIVVDTVPIPTDEDDEDAIVQRIADAITPSTRVISISHILYSTGLRMPVERICRLARDRNCLAVIDGAQAVGAMPVDVKAIGCHVYAASGHKWLLGPKGTGFLFLGADLGDRVAPMALQSGRRANADSSGLGNIVGLFGLAAAIDYVGRVGLERIERHNRALREDFRSALARLGRVTIAGPTQPGLLSATLAIRLPEGVEPRPLRVAIADRHNVFVRPVDDHGFKALRISAHLYNGPADVEALTRALHAELG